MHRLTWAIALLLLVTLLLTETSIAYISYTIDARVGGSEFILNRATQNLTFTVDGTIAGSGNFSRYSKIKNNVGVKSDERTSAVRGGYLSLAEKKRLETVEGPVVIVVDAQSYQSNTTIPDPEGGPPHFITTVSESAYITVDEAWPYGYADYRKISYEGPGIRTLERDESEGDVVLSSSDSWKLEKESLYNTYKNRTFYDVYITPSGVIANQFSNRSSFYALNLESTGSLSHLDIIQQSTPRNPETRITQDYSGQHNMTLKVKMDNYFYRVIDEDADAWLPCCFEGYLTMPTYYQRGTNGFGSNVKGIFDCTCWKQPGECATTAVQY